MPKTIEQIRDSVVESVAETTATGAEKLAEGSERMAEAAKEGAKRTRSWADDVSGAKNRKRLLVVAALLTAVVAISIALVRGNQA